MNRKQLTLLTLISISVTIAFVLPKVVDDPLFTIKENPIESSPQVPQLTPSQLAEKQKYRLTSQELLAQIITMRDSLAARGVRKWGQVDFFESLKSTKLNSKPDERFLTSSNNR